MIGWMGRLTNCLKQESIGKPFKLVSSHYSCIQGWWWQRLCVDYRALNKITRTYVWPMPRVEDIFAKLGNAKFYRALDLRSGYHHIALDKGAIKKTAYVVPFGKYEYLKVPFNLAQIPAYFQNLMNKVLNGLNFTVAYLDDVIIFSETAEHHLKNIQFVLTRLKQANLKLRKSKCAFFKKELHYLGHLLTTDAIKPWTEEIKAIFEMKPPTNQKGVREADLLMLPGQWPNLQKWHKMWMVWWLSVRFWVFENLPYWVSNSQISKSTEKICCIYWCQWSSCSSSTHPGIQRWWQWDERNAYCLPFWTVFWHTIQVEHCC